MKTVNRGYIYVAPKQAFCDWAKMNDPEFVFDEADELEGNIYLIEEDFMEIEPIIEANFKKIFSNECLAVMDDEDGFPKPTLELFLEWFHVVVGGTVFDTRKEALVTEDV